MVKKQSTGMKLLSVFLGAVIGGFMWRCRGEGGFGSSWGLYGVGFALMLLIFIFYGDRKGMKYEMIPLGGLMLGLSVTGYGTVICQMAGFVESDVPYTGALPAGVEPVFITDRGSVYAPVNPFSGALIFFLMAVTLIALFSFFVVSLFSKKEYTVKHYIIAIAIFFIASTVFKATVSHLIVRLINPEQVQYAALGLKDVGIDLTPFKAYMTHFLDRRWTQDIPFFENYYMSIEHISDVLAIFTLSFWALVFRKDRLTCFGSLLLDVLAGAASTALDPLVAARSGIGFFEGVSFPAWFMKIADWGVWEFATGFFVGLFVMLFLAFAADKNSVQWGKGDDTPLFTDKTQSFIINFGLTVFILGVAPARAVGIRFARLLANHEVLPDDEPFGTILTVVLSVAFGVFMIKIIGKNIFRNGGNAFDMLPARFAVIALPAYLGMCFVVYFFFDDAVIFANPWDVTTPMMLIASALIAVALIPLCASRRKAGIRDEGRGNKAIGN